MIRASGLTKRYRIGARPHYETLRDTVADAVGRMLGRGAQREARTIWALDGVTFDIGAGEAVGVIGRNGAGKSTLLKVLARITTPTGGRAELYGRVGSVLEIGTGFHGELTGRENIYLNGAILGMRRRDVARRFDEIVSFAEVETFLETPLKHYSSGMWMRLAFAVAAHMDPQILLIDEVLSVGDVPFQEKSLAKMREIVRDGRTVLFVSHDLEAVASLCTRCFVMERGRLILDDAPRIAIAGLLGHERAEPEGSPVRAHGDA